MKVMAISAHTNIWISVVVFIMASHALLLDMVSADPCEHPWVNGCSVPFRSWSLVRRFTPACNRHDICYACGVEYGFSRKKCDLAFHDDMKKICRMNRLKRSKSPVQDGRNSSINIGGCLTAANIGYSLVRGWGSTRYEATPQPFCRDNFVRACLPGKR